MKVMRQFTIIAIAAGAIGAASIALVQGQVSSNGPGGSHPTNDDPKAQPHLNGTLPSVTTLLMFEGKAEEAMNFYMSLFKNAKVIGIHRWEAGEPGPENGIKHAMFSLDGQMIRCMDSGVDHEFTFTPAISLFVACKSESEIDTLFAKLSEGGETLVPCQEYPFAKKYAWVADRFGVSWQLHLPNH
jgi:predicted 3-demethylubiquinone-9 3-methyltransferase (glyoxalase superfamily)